MARKAKMKETDKDTIKVDEFEFEKVDFESVLTEVKQFVPSGSTLLDGALGGGYPLGRMVHVVGNSSAGKTQLAIEAAANFCKKYPNGKVFYCDAEAAFDYDYAARVGFPTDKDRVSLLRTKTGAPITVESLASMMMLFLKTIEPSEVKDENGKVTIVPGTPGVFILDSVDSVPTLNDVNNPGDRDGYETSKPKMLGKLARSTVQRMANADALFFVISQTRQDINGTPGTHWSGGEWLKFYASQRLIIKMVEKLEKEINGVKYAYGVKSNVYVAKNKCGVPFRNADINILFEYGIDDLTGNLDYLALNKAVAKLPDSVVKGADGKLLVQTAAMIKRVRTMPPQEQREMINKISDSTYVLYEEIQTILREQTVPTLSKYGD